MGKKSKSRKLQSRLPRQAERRDNSAAVDVHRLDAWLRPSALKNCVFAIALGAAVFLAYLPAWHGGLIWDDDAHVTRPELQSSDGLYRIWFDLRATQQYYPLLHSAFWLEHKLWGDATLGYHLVNLALHVLAALLAACLLRRLAVPGAWLAAAIFALHPVQVESVAWISELKNTLSAVFYLGAAITYLRFDQTRKLTLYLPAIGLFTLGLLSKTVVATLPAALLVVFWWQRGRLQWRRDVGPLLPFFALGVAAGLFTAWVERALIGAQGADFDLSLGQRCLICGRAIWFYLGKFFWPADLIFVYPHWQISVTAWQQYLYPVAALLLLAVLWRRRRRTRAPLAAALIFVGTLFPVLGFCNVYPFIFSFVADHFQYLASLALATLFSAGTALLLTRLKHQGRALGQCGFMALVAVLAVLSWRQSRMYANIEALYRSTLQSNPDCWMAHNNLGNVLIARGQVDEAIEHYRKALAIKPNYVEAHDNLAVALAGRGQVDEAIEHYLKALEIKPDAAEAHNNLANALAGCGRSDEAIVHYLRALEIKPGFAEAHNNLGLALAKRGRTDEAIGHYRRAVEIRPDFADAHNNLGVALISAGPSDEAIDRYRNALQIKPDYAEAHFNLANALATRRQTDEAMVHYQKALEHRPTYAEAHNNFAVALAGRGRGHEAIVHYLKAVAIKPDYVEAHNNLASALVGLGQVNEAIPHYRKAVAIKPDLLEAHFNLGLALASCGKKDGALEQYQKALELAAARNDTALAESIRARISELRR
jgi:protein O-mannosyl-transferase